MRTKLFNKIQDFSENELINFIRNLNDFDIDILNSLKKIEIQKGFRKPRLALYDHTLHLIGGGQKYGLSLIDVLKEFFKITIITHKKVELEDFNKWYGFDFKDIEIKVIDLDFFKDDNHIDPNKVMINHDNPFEVVSYESMNYDIFINNSMNEMIYPFSPVSIIICHFPERRPEKYFYVNKYDYIVYNSNYTAKWIRNKWKSEPNVHIYPPVDMIQDNDVDKKENIILSVARFEVGGSKKQYELVKSFIMLKRVFQEETKDWKLILVGGSGEKNPYLDKIKKSIIGRNDIEIKVNIKLEELKLLYSKARIFWHMCGLNNNDPSLIEHFGMSIVESMQNSLVPIVYDGGGQREIVEHGLSGFRVKSQFELITKTIELITNKELFEKMSLNSKKRGYEFSIEIFNEKVIAFFNEIMKNDFKNDKWRENFG